MCAHTRTHGRPALPLCGNSNPQTLPCSLWSGKEFPPCSNLPCRLLLHVPNPCQALGRRGVRAGKEAESPRGRPLRGNVVPAYPCLSPCSVHTRVPAVSPQGLAPPRKALAAGSTRWHWGPNQGRVCPSGNVPTSRVSLKAADFTCCFKHRAQLVSIKTRLQSTLDRTNGGRAESQGPRSRI